MIMEGHFYVVVAANDKPHPRWGMDENGAMVHETYLKFAEQQVQKLLAAERDCRTCKHWTPHHRSDVMHCSAALRCVAGSSYKRAGVVQLWEAAPVDAAF